MGKKGIVANVVRTAIAAAEKAIAPSPLAKSVIAAAAAGAAAEIERRAKEMAEPVEKALKRNVKQSVVDPVDAALAPAAKSERKPKASARNKAGRGKASVRKGAGARKSTTATRGRAAGTARGSTTAKRKRGGVKKKASRAKRR